MIIPFKLITVTFPLDLCFDECINYDVNADGLSGYTSGFAMSPTPISTST